MIAFVFSGGGNRAALQVGAAQALVSDGVYPDLLVGTSAGAMNAALLAWDHSPRGAERLATAWLQISRQQVYAEGRARLAWRLATHRQSLYSPTRLEDLVRAGLPDGVASFADLPTPLRVVATDLILSEPYVFGDNGSDALLDALMASAAIPPFFPPREYHGRLLVDGAIVADLPISIAVDRGATTVYAFDLAPDAVAMPRRWSAAETTWRSVTTMMLEQRDREVALCAANPRVVLHHLRLRARGHPDYHDFSHTSALIADGRAAAEAYLRRPAHSRSSTDAAAWRTHSGDWRPGRPAAAAPGRPPPVAELGGGVVADGAVRRA